MPDEACVMHARHFQALIPPLSRSFQSPVEVPGVSNSDFLRLAANARRKQLGQEELGPLEFYGYVMPKVRAPVKPRECPIGWQ